MEVVIHLAGEKRNNLDWEDLFKLNVHGTRNVYEAAVREKVKKVIFASTLHIHQMRKLFKSNKKISEKTPAVSSNAYGLSKILGERIGEDYHVNYGIGVVNLRLGSVTEDGLPLRNKDGNYREIAMAHWISNIDLMKIMNASLKAEGLITVPCTSANKKPLVDPKCVKRILGVNLSSSSEKYIKS
ncbi:hypothetical protein COY00_03960 [Candidatus Pacearchaeota archaeon CG_4_10_14_0_2_um_filter_35_33]|nr:MAG: hypothetical protein COY79_03955 [Candidatus Pacearchaeota archaeon CG_4_10_14_0_8_um_filter_35_169]PIZ79420.1 MAG: hypothetical protein COY00_03960 [Candidatus Pacearchaeota archaeon CG_4_10_14_0_2_um_filter_35_33]